MSGQLIRKSSNGQVLLLPSGAIATGAAHCIFYHIAVQTETRTHSGCVELKLSDGRKFSKRTTGRGRQANRQYDVGWNLDSLDAGVFDVLIRWDDGHSPYPEIDKMNVWVFGIDTGTKSYPKAPNNYKKVAHVEIKDDGQVLVDGKPAKIGV